MTKTIIINNKKLSNDHFDTTMNFGNSLNHTQTTVRCLLDPSSVKYFCIKFQLICYTVFVALVLSLYTATDPSFFKAQKSTCFQQKPFVKWFASLVWWCNISGKFHRDSMFSFWTLRVCLADSFENLMLWQVRNTFGWLGCLAELCTYLLALI